MPDTQPSLFDHINPSSSGLSRGLIAHLRFNGNVTDSQGTNDGTVTGTTTYSTGKLGKAFSFNGSSEVVLANETNFDFDVDDPWTISFWIKTAGADGMLFSKGGRYGWAGKGFGLQYSNGYGRIIFVSSTSTSGSNYLLLRLGNYATINDSNWHHVVVTYDGVTNSGVPQASSFKTYEDGGTAITATVIATNTSTAADWLNNDGATIGNTSGALSNTYFTGELDDYRIYNRELSSTEIAEIYNSGDGTEVAVARQRFVENFSGDELDTDRWNHYTTGSATSGMSDSVNGGYYISTTNSWDQVRVNTNNLGRQFDPTGSKLIAVMKYTNSASASAGGVGLVADTTDVELVSNAGAAWSLSGNNHYFTTHDGTTRQITTTGITIDNAYHTYTIELNGTSVVGTIDGVNTTTNSTNIPLGTSKLQPNFWHKSGSETFNIRYFEAYNT